MSTSSLATLASQHHASEYNKAKFGPQGSSLPYAPLSIAMPDHFHNLRTRQQSYFYHPWWPSQTTKPTLQQELSSAIASPLQNNHPSPATVKTSVSHPINISFVVPPDLIPLISSHLVLSSSFSPDCPIFELPPPLCLDRLVAARPHCTSVSHPETTSSPLVSRFPILWLPNSPSPLPFANDTNDEQGSYPRLPVRTRSNVSHAMHAAMNAGIATLPPSPLYSQDPPLSTLPYKPHKAAEDNTNTFTLHHSNASSVSLSLSLSLSVTRNPPSIDLDLDLCAPPPSLANQNFSPDAALEQSKLPAQTNLPPTIPSNLQAPPFTIGNLLMSSCPGKKVRLDGPTKGRSAVCRDLDTDLRRIRDLGVGCIVCCLDDAELDFLGASWDSYQAAAHTAGLDVLRIPMPEGLAPLAPCSFDVRLTELIERYSIRGVPVLVHCRGGVGRAGVVACCWIIKLGLCGWPSGTNTGGEHDSDKGWTSQETIDIVERAIGLVRRRRSMKAVETYEQVCFLVDYVDFLRNGLGARVSCNMDGRISL